MTILPLCSIIIAKFLNNDNKILFIQVDRRNTGVGSAASASGNGPMFLFPNNGKNATTTQEPKATDRPLSVAQAAKLVELYRQLGCLSIGSSADGNVYENVIRKYIENYYSFSMHNELEYMISY